MNYRQHMNEQIRIQRRVLVPLFSFWLFALSVTMLLYLCDSWAIFFTKGSCFILSVLVFAAYFGSGPRCPHCEDDLRSLASRFELALKWKRLPESVKSCPNCGIEFV